MVEAIKIGVAVYFAVVTGAYLYRVARRRWWPKKHDANYMAPWKRNGWGRD